MSASTSASGSSSGMEGLVAAVAAAIQDDDTHNDKKRKADVDSQGSKKPAPSKRSKNQSKPMNDLTPARTRRLEQNRRAAVESRRRKKVMIDELQRSVSFYTKANANLKFQNQELESKIIVAKQQARLPATGLDARESASLECPNSKLEVSLPPTNSPKESPTTCEASYAMASTGTIPDETSASPLPEAVSSADHLQAEQAQFTATQAIYNTRGYPQGAARLAASAFSQFVGLTGSTPGMPRSYDNQKVPEAPAPAAVAPLVKPSLQMSVTPLNRSAPASNFRYHSPQQENESTSGGATDEEDDYVKALNEFAMQQAAAASAAAAAANAAIQAANLHKFMRLKGKRPKLTPTFPFQQQMHFQQVPCPLMIHDQAKSKSHNFCSQNQQP